MRVTRIDVRMSQEILHHWRVPVTNRDVKRSDTLKKGHDLSLAKKRKKNLLFRSEESTESFVTRVPCYRRISFIFRLRIFTYLSFGVQQMRIKV